MRRERLRTFALERSGAYVEFPWGERVVKVTKKIFVFLGMEPVADAGLAFRIKLPIQGDDVLSLPFTEPAIYARLGDARFLPGEQPLIKVACALIHGKLSHGRPRKLLAQLDSGFEKA